MYNQPIILLPFSYRSSLYLAALWNAVGKEIGGFPKAPILMVIEKDEIAETQKTKQNTHRFHGFPVKYNREVTTRLLA